MNKPPEAEPSSPIEIPLPQLQVGTGHAFAAGVLLNIVLAARRANPQEFTARDTIVSPTTPIEPEEVSPTPRRTIVNAAPRPIYDPTRDPREPSVRQLQKIVVPELCALDISELADPTSEN